MNLVAVKDIDVPQDLQRAMAKQAVAERERGGPRSFMPRVRLKPVHSTIKYKEIEEATDGRA